MKTEFEEFEKRLISECTKDLLERNAREIKEDIKNMLPCAKEQICRNLGVWTQPAIERALGLPQRYLSKAENLELPETKALLKFITMFPWLLNVADSGFDKVVATREIVKAGVDLGMLEVK